jgi:hypothetical protein
VKPAEGKITLANADVIAYAGDVSGKNVYPVYC